MNEPPAGAVDGQGGADGEDSEEVVVEADGESEGYIEAFGHRYHRSGKIYIPFDEKEQERMRAHHRLFRRCLNGQLTTLTLPLDVGTVLDLGTGVGEWAIEMATRYPQARIYGMDVSAIQRRHAVPPNVTFVRDDVENAWPFADGSLDFVHARTISGGVRDWPALLRQAFAKLRPGGVIEVTEINHEIHDFDGKFDDHLLVPDFIQVFRDFARRVGMVFDASPHAQAWLLEAGYESVVQRKEILPLGDWAQDDKMRDQQILFNEVTSKHFASPVGLMFKRCGWTYEQYQAALPKFWEHLANTPARPYSLAVFTTARKPRE
ncbi:S-adenosyl-L-methionine-dependent methyltransferase [Xylariomycetidae sp. FL0641]|nr:S-adenosyl-L-methionine-dependent methyltransferase [Xylariomycetidae sp. FL0641]